jgi:AcrR family transcriptional regulator
MTKGEMTRQRIIMKSAPIFNMRGYIGCSMQDIMDATDMEKGGIYRHFSCKEELAVEAFRYSLATVVKMRAEKVDQVEGSIEQLRYLVRHFVQAPSNIQGGCPLMNTAIDSDDGNAALRRLASEGIQEWKGRLSAIVEKGIAQGEICRNAQPRRVANTIVATLEGALMISRLEGTNDALDDAQASLDLILRGLAAAQSLEGEMLRLA